MLNHCYETSDQVSVTGEGKWLLFKIYKVE